MKSDNKNNDVMKLPLLAEIFESLRRGKHISARDGELFYSVKQQESLYEALFAKLGFKLVSHARDFFYFYDTTNFTDTSARMAVFMFILVESLADQGEVVEDAVLTRSFAYKDLPHLKSERYQTYMREAGVTTQEDLTGIVRTMERFGFTRREDGETFSFEVPIYRFLDICLAMAGGSEKTTTAKLETQSEEQL